MKDMFDPGCFVQPPLFHTHARHDHTPERATATAPCPDWVSGGRVVTISAKRGCEEARSSPEIIILCMLVGASGVAVMLLKAW